MIDPPTNGTAAENCAALMKLIDKTTGHKIFVSAQLLYVVPTMVYVKFLLIALMCGKHTKTRYSSIFYSFIIMGAWAAVLLHLPKSILENIAKRPHWFCPTFAALAEPTFWLDIYVYLLQVLDTLRILAGTAIVLYRFHSLRNLEDAKRLWETRKTHIILLLLAIPAVVYAPIWTTPSHAVIADEEMVFVNAGWKYYNHEAVHCIICLICTSIVLGSQAILMRETATPSDVELSSFKDDKAVESTKLVGDKIDHCLNIVGIVEIIIIPIRTIFMCRLFARDWFERKVAVVVLYAAVIVSDALGFAPIWTLYFTSEQIREDATPFRSLFAKCFKQCRIKEEEEME